MPRANIDECGFELSQNWKPSLTHEEYYKLHEDSTLKDKLYAEVGEYLKAHLGAAHVHVMNHQVRNESKNAGSYHGAVAGYAHTEPHTDSSALGGDEVYLAMLSSVPEFTKHEGKGRYMYLNMWRNISETPIGDNHLAVLDERTVVKPDDYIVKDLFMSYGENSNGAPDIHVPQYRINARHHHLHKWYYFPGMAHDEALLFKQADSDHTKQSRLCFHVAVPDTNAPEGTPPRESIELRCIAIFPDAELNTVPTVELISADQINMNGGMPHDLKSGSSVSSFGACFAAPLMWMLGKLFAPKVYGEEEAAIPKYVAALTGVVTSFDKWPQEGKTYIAGLCRNVEEDEGIKKVAAILSTDSTGHFKLKDKSPEFQQKVSDACCQDQKFIEVVQKYVFSTL